MALRLTNTGTLPLTVDLRGGGEPLRLGAGETSPPLREELLYGHPFLAQWEAAGLVARLPARMDDVLRRERAEAGLAEDEDEEADGEAGGAAPEEGAAANTEAAPPGGQAPAATAEGGGEAPAAPAAEAPAGEPAGGEPPAAGAASGEGVPEEKTKGKPPRR